MSGNVPPVVDVGQWAGLELARSHVLRFVFKNSEFGFIFYFFSVV